MDVLVSRGEKSVGKIFDKILEKRYHREPFQITFDELLNWDTWLTFLKIHSKLKLLVFHPHTVHSDIF